MTKENPLAGIDDLITQLALTLGEFHTFRHDKQARLMGHKQNEARELRDQIRQKVAQANLIINELIETRQDKETDGMVAISRRRLSRLVADETRLAALHVAGVDNWEGYADAMSSLEDL